MYIVGEQSRLLGVVDLASLLRAPADGRIDGLARASALALSAVSTLAAALGHAGWEQASTLPVVERGGRLIGVLHRATLNRALQRSRAEEPPEAGGSLSGALARGYWDALAGGVAAAVSLLPTGPPAVRSADDA